MHVNQFNVIIKVAAEILYRLIIHPKQPQQLLFYFLLIHLNIFISLHLPKPFLSHIFQRWCQTVRMLETVPFHQIPTNEHLKYIGSFEKVHLVVTLVRFNNSGKVYKFCSKHFFIYSNGAGLIVRVKVNREHFFNFLRLCVEYLTHLFGLFL